MLNSIIIDPPSRARLVEDAPPTYPPPAFLCACATSPHTRIPGCDAACLHVAALIRDPYHTELSPTATANDPVFAAHRIGRCAAHGNAGGVWCRIAHRNTGGYRPFNARIGINSSVLSALRAQTGPPRAALPDGQAECTVACGFAGTVTALTQGHAA
jgi:hypothetical protein